MSFGWRVRSAAAYTHNVVAYQRPRRDLGKGSSNRLTYGALVCSRAGVYLRLGLPRTCHGECQLSGSFLVSSSTLLLALQSGICLPEPLGWW